MAEANSLLQALGGEAGCRRLASAFYGNVASDPVLRPLFPGKSLRCQIEEFSAFLVQLLGGDEKLSQYRWWLSLKESHNRFKITETHRAAWLTQMGRTIESAGLDQATAEELLEFFTISSTYVVQGSAEPIRDSRLAGPWEETLALDALVSQIIAGEDETVLAGLSRFASRPSIYVGILSRMMRSGRGALIRAVAEEIRADPSLAHRFHAGRTLLHNAAGAGCAEVVSILLNLGTDPNVLDGGNHPPLYCLANEWAGESGPEIVDMLLEAGADVDMASGVTKTTPLHMAARRGHVAIAGALLRHGASVHARDGKGCTPLDRAIRCRKPEIAGILQRYELEHPI